MLINRDHITTAKLIYKYDTGIYFLEEKKFWGVVTRQAGYYFGGFGVSKPDHTYIENGKVYEKPQVSIRFSNGKTTDVYFETESKARQFYEELNLPPLIQINND